MAKLFSILKRLRADALALWDDSFLRSTVELSRFYKFIHFWVLVWKSFNRNRCLSRAASLSYTTLFALIPILVVAVGVTSFFLKSEGAEQIESFIQQFVDRMIPPTVMETNVKRMASLDANPAGIPGATNDALSFSTNFFVESTLSNPPATANALILPAPGGDARVLTAQKEAAQYIHGFIQKTYRHVDAAVHRDHDAAQHRGSVQ